MVQTSDLTNQCRVSFENWGHTKKMPMQYDDFFGYYRFALTEDAWLIWQEAWKQRSEYRDPEK